MKPELEARNEQIAEKYKQGLPAKLIAREYNLSPDYVNRLMCDMDVKHGRACLVRNGKRERVEIYGEIGKQLRKHSGKTHKPMSLIVHEALTMYFKVSDYK